MKQLILTVALAVCPLLGQAVTVLSVQSCVEHGASGYFCLPVTYNAVEPRIGPITLVFEFDAPILSVPYAYGGANNNHNLSVTEVFISGPYVAVVFTPFDGYINTIRMGNVNDSPQIFSQSLGALIADVNGNGQVTAADVAAIRSQSGQVVTAGNYRLDLNGDGVIDAADIIIARARVFNSLTPLALP